MALADECPPDEDELVGVWAARAIGYEPWRDSSGQALRVPWSGLVLFQGTTFDHRLVNLICQGAPPLTDLVWEDFLVRLGQAFGLAADEAKGIARMCCGQTMGALVVGEPDEVDAFVRDLLVEALGEQV